MLLHAMRKSHLEKAREARSNTDANVSQSGGKTGWMGSILSGSVESLSAWQRSLGSGVVGVVMFVALIVLRRVRIAKEAATRQVCVCVCVCVCVSAYVLACASSIPAGNR